MYRPFKSISFFCFIMIAALSQSFAQSGEFEMIAGRQSSVGNTIGVVAAANLKPDNWINGFALILQPQFELDLSGDTHTPNPYFFEVEVYHRSHLYESQYFDLSHQVGLGYQQVVERGELDYVEEEPGCETDMIMGRMGCSDKFVYHSTREHTPMVSQSFKARLHFTNYFGIYATQRTSLGLQGYSSLMGFGVSVGVQ